MALASRSNRALRSGSAEGKIFDRDRSIEACVFRLVDFAHAPRPQRRLDEKTAESCAWVSAALAQDRQATGPAAGYYSGVELGGWQKFAPPLPVRVLSNCYQNPALERIQAQQSV